MSGENIKRKKGYLRINDQLINSFWPELSIIFKDFRPTHIEFCHWDNDTWWYWGISEKFDIVNEGEVVPCYDVIFTRLEDETYTYKFNKVK